ncbi:MAG: hypothetical protein IJW51_03220 [Clostridia bacterium]|nr:hypothetical protein [Clostridia bacterium]
MQKRNIIIVTVSIILVLCLAAGCFFVFGSYLPRKKEQAEWERFLQEYYNSKIAFYRDENEAYAEVDVAFLGDSLTDGYDLAHYYPQYKTANRGIGGDTTHGLLQRLEVSVYALQPKVAVLLIGCNNLDTMLEDYESILKGLQENLPNTQVVLVSLTPMGKERAEKNEKAAYNNVIIKKLADKYDFAFVDLFSPLLDETTGEIRANYTTDGVHLTPLGYSVFTDALTPVLEELLNDK